MFLIIKKIFILWKYIITHGLFYKILNFFFFSFNYLNIFNISSFFYSFIIGICCLVFLKRKYLKIYSLIFSFILLNFGIFLYIKWYFNYLELISFFSFNSSLIFLENVEKNYQDVLFQINIFFSYDNPEIIAYFRRFYEIYLLIFSELIYIFDINKFKEYIFFSSWSAAMPFCISNINLKYLPLFSISNMSNLYFYKFSLNYLLFFQDDFVYYLCYLFENKFSQLKTHFLYNRILLITYFCFFLEFFFFYNISFSDFIEIIEITDFYYMNRSNFIFFNIFSTQYNFQNNFLFYFSFNKNILLFEFNNNLFWKNLLLKTLDLNSVFDTLSTINEDLIIQLYIIQEDLLCYRQIFKNCFFLFFFLSSKFNLYNTYFFNIGVYSFFYETLLLNYIKSFENFSLYLSERDEISFFEYMRSFVFQLAALSQEEDLEQLFSNFTTLLLYSHDKDIYISNYLLTYTEILYNYLLNLQYYSNIFLMCTIKGQNFFLFGLDSFSFIFFLLTLFIFPICFLLIWNIEAHLLLLLLVLFAIEFLLVGVFTSLDLISFYICFESILVPMTILILNWGSRTRKIKAMYYFFLYTLITSLIMLLAIVLIFFFYGTLVFTELFYVTELKQLTFINKLIWIFFFFALAAKIPMYPFHIWLPEAHVEAPTVGSVILAALLLKVGGYGFIRILLLLFPETTNYFRPFIFTIALISIIYSSLILLRQIDMKKLIAYSSIAHMNIAVIGIFSNTLDSINSGIYFLISHGFSSSGLFILVGVLYDRFHTRIIYNYSGLIQIMPKFSFVFFFFSLANFGFPGTANFISEVGILIALAEKNIIYFFFVFGGIFFSVIYSLFLFIRILFGRLNLYFLTINISKIDINKREFWIFFFLIYEILFFGIHTLSINNLLNSFLLYTLLL